MNLFAVCRTCDWNPKPYDGKRQWGDFDKCTKCGNVMDVWTESGVRNEEARIAFSTTDRRSSSVRRPNNNR